MVENPEVINLYDCERGWNLESAIWHIVKNLRTIYIYAILVTLLAHCLTTKDSNKSPLHMCQKQSPLKKFV